VPNILDLLAGGAKYPRIFGRGCQISYVWWGFQFSWRGARFPCMEVPAF